MPCLFSEEVHLEQLMASVETQDVVISSDNVDSVAYYIVKSSIQGSRLEIIIQDGNTNSRLCRKVTVLYSFGAYS